MIKRYLLSRSTSKILGILLIIGSFGGGWLLMDVRHFLEKPLRVGAEGSILLIESGTNLKRLAAQLHQNKVIDHPAYLVWLGRYKGSANKIHTGEYLIEPGTTPSVLLDKIMSGKQMQHALTLVEGWTFNQMMAVINSHEKLTHTLAGLSPAQIMEKLGHAGQHPEGRFYPDTYHFPRGTTDLEFLRRAYVQMEQYLQQEWPTREAGLPIKTPYEALILASIVEKETAVPEERPAIAGVFIRRLQKGMRLQTDPTVIYGLGKNYDGNIRKKDLLADTPYNTYLRKGLPPTPIAMPSKEAIAAVLHPAPGSALFFVSRRDGTHKFSDTLAEHNKAVQDFQLTGR